MEETAKERQASKPAPLKDIDWSRVQARVEEYINTVAQRGYPPKDCNHYIFEEAVRAVFGPRIWKWENKYNDAY